MNKCVALEAEKREKRREEKGRRGKCIECGGRARGGEVKGSERRGGGSRRGKGSVGESTSRFIARCVSAVCERPKLRNEAGKNGSRQRWPVIGEKRGEQQSSLGRHRATLQWRASTPHPHVLRISINNFRDKNKCEFFLRFVFIVLIRLEIQQ